MGICEGKETESTIMMENHMDKQMEHAKETGVLDKFCPGDRESARR